MRINLKYLILIVVQSIVFLSCSKNELDKTYKDISRISIGGVTPDSVTFTFATLPLTTNTADLSLYATIAGQLSDVDREFKIQIDPDLTTAEPSEYSIPSVFKIEAGKVSATIPITVKRSERIKDTSIKLALRVVENENFALIGNTQYQFVWTDDVLKPVNWSDIYWGYYSKVKHRFFLVNTDYDDLSLVTDIASIMHAASQALKALTDYNNTHDEPYKNEFGVPIGICKYCD